MRAGLFASRRNGPNRARSSSISISVPHYGIPPGYRIDTMDPTQRYVLDGAGQRVLNPSYQEEIRNFRFNKCGIAGDLATIIGTSTVPFARNFWPLIGIGGETLRELCSGGQ